MHSLCSETLIYNLFSYLHALAHLLETSLAVEQLDCPVVTTAVILGLCHYYLTWYQVLSDSAPGTAMCQDWRIYETSDAYGDS